MIPLALCVAALAAAAPAPSSGQWRPHAVLQANGPGKWAVQSASHQMVTGSWNRVAAVPYIAYAPEKHRILMLVSCDYPHQAMVLWSDDAGASWTAPRFLHVDSKGKPDTGMGVGLTYLGQGRAIVYANGGRYQSVDYGETWSLLSAVEPTGEGKTFYQWDPALVLRDGAGAVRLAETGYTMDVPMYESAVGPGYSHGHIRFSEDLGKTWGATLKVPQWRGVSEVALVRARNGDLIAACRTDIPERIKSRLDHFEGLAVSRSIDGGRSWSTLNRLYEYGRHHPCLAVLPNGSIVLTYVVRLGYTETADGHQRFGIEAVVSRDNGLTWDMDHRYVLARWLGTIKGPNSWYPSSQATSTVVMPDGALLTAYGTGYRCKDPGDGHPAPRDAGMVRWRPEGRARSRDHSFGDVAWNADARNLIDPGPGIGHTPDTTPGTVLAGAPELVCADLKFPEGPAWDGVHSVFVSNCAGDSVTRAGIDGTVEPRWMTAAPTGSFRKTNGLAFDRDGALFACDGESRAVLRITPDRRCETFASACDGKPLHGPNDLAFAPDGALYFTDPAPTRTGPPDGAVYRVDPQTRAVRRVASGLSFPNGIAFAANGRTLYVCESVPNRVVAFEVRRDGALGPATVFADLAPAGAGEPDGLAVDGRGRLWIAHFGRHHVVVVGPDGRIERTIPLPYDNAMGPTNVEFAGRDMQWLYITDPGKGALYRLRTDVPGLRLFRSPGAH